MYKLPSKFYVDIPTKECVGNPDGPWEPLATFDDKAAAIAFIREHIDPQCDDEGRVSLLSGG